MEKIFNSYESNINKLKALSEDNIPTSLRFFNIRVRLAIDITISFKGLLFPTNINEVRSAYSVLIKMMETWNAYEALIRFVGEESSYKIPKVSKHRIFSNKYINYAGAVKFCHIL